VRVISGKREAFQALSVPNSRKNAVGSRSLL